MAEFVVAYFCFMLPRDQGQTSKETTTTTTITMYYRDVAFSGDRRLQKKGDTSPNSWGEAFRNYIRLLPKPSYPAL